MTNRNGEIYWGYDEILKKQNAKLELDNLPEGNKELIKRFQEHLATSGAKQARIAKITWGLRGICRMIGDVLLSEANLSDIKKAVKEIHTGNYEVRNKKGVLIKVASYSEATKSDYKRVLKHFYRWYKQEDARLAEPPELDLINTVGVMMAKDSAKQQEAIDTLRAESKARKEALATKEAAQRVYDYIESKEIKTTVKAPKVDPGSTIKEEELRTVLEKGCKNEMERAFLAVLHESGVRIGEMLGMRRQDISQEAGLWTINVDGKTGERSVFIRDAIPHLARWLDVHPDQSDNAPIWVSQHNRWNGQPLRYYGARRLIDRSFERAQLSHKRKNPHWFRHSRATLLAIEYSDEITCKQLGHGSQQLKRYRHVTNDQVKQAVMLKKGLIQQEERERVEPIKCLCDALNAPNSRYCRKCGKALSLSTAYEDEVTKASATEEAMKLFAHLAQNPQALKRISELAEKFRTNA